MKTYLKLFLPGFIIFINSVYLFAGVWSPYTGISLTGSYSRFATAGSYVFYSASFSDLDQRTDGNNVTTVSDSLNYNNNASETLWSCGIDLNNKTKSSSYNGSSLSGIVPANQSAGDYNVSITANDLALIYNDDDTGSRNDSPVTKQVTTTIINLSLNCSTNATYTNNNIIYPLRITPLNDDDDNNNGIKDNQETQSVQGENDLVPITFTPSPVNSSTIAYCKVKISFSGVRVFANSDRSGEITNNTLYNLSDFEEHSSKTVYAEPMGMGVGSVSVSMYSDYTSSNANQNDTFKSANEANVSKTVYIAAASVNVSGANINDNNEMTEPGYVIGKYDELNTTTGTLNLSQTVPSQITDYSVKILKSNNKVQLFYYTFDSNTFTQIENEITDDTVFNKGEIPTSVNVKGLEYGKTTITAKLNIKEINGETNTINNFHTDSMIVNTVETDIYLSGLNNEDEMTSPGWTLGLNRSNELFFDLNNISDNINNYTDYRLSFSVPQNLALYTNSDLTDLIQSVYTIGTDTLPSRLYMKGVNAGSGTLTMQFMSPSNNYSPTPIHKDSILVNVIYCDLAVDSNNDNTITQTIGGADDSIEEQTPGKYIALNSDDDDVDGIVDYEDDIISGQNMSSVTGDNEFGQVKLFSPLFNNYNMGTNPYNGWKMTLTYSNNIKLYSDTRKKTSNNPTPYPGQGNQNITYTDCYVPSNTTWTVGTDTPPTTLYIEGINNGVGEISYTVYDPNDNEIFSDMVKVTVEPIIDEVEFVTPSLNESVGGVIPVKIKRIQRYGHSTGVLLVKETNSHITETDHPQVDWVSMPTNNNYSLVLESTTQNPENRTTERVYRYMWNTITTPMPQVTVMAMMYNQTHNGQHTLRYEQTIGALPKINNDLTVNLNNLTISTNSDILVWKGLDENNNLIDDDYPKITLSVNDNDTNDPYNVEVKIFHTGAEYSGTSNWQPVKTITLTNCTGSTQTITWDGSVDSGVNSQNALSHDNWTDQYNELLEANNNIPMGITVPAPTVAEPWTYTYDITVTQTDTETYTFPNQSQPITYSQYDNTWLRSKYLNISRTTDENGKYIYDIDYDGCDDKGTTEDNAGIDPITGELENYEADDEYIYLMRAYNLTDSLSANNNPQHAKSGTINMLDTEDVIHYITNIESCECDAHNSQDGCNVYDGTTYHNIRFNVPANIMPPTGLYIFYFGFEDNHANLYRNHTSKNTLQLNGKRSDLPIEYFNLGNNTKIIWCRGNANYYKKSLTFDTAYYQAPYKWVVKDPNIPNQFTNENPGCKYQIRAAINGAFFDASYSVVGAYKNYGLIWNNTNSIDLKKYSFAMSLNNKNDMDHNYRYVRNNYINGLNFQALLEKYSSYFKGYNSGLGCVANLRFNNQFSNINTSGVNDFYNPDNRTLFGWTDKNDTFLIYTYGDYVTCQNLISDLENTSNPNSIYTNEHYNNLKKIKKYGLWGNIKNVIVLDSGGSSSIYYKKGDKKAIGIDHIYFMTDNSILPRKIPNIICVYAGVDKL